MALIEHEDRLRPDELRSAVGPVLFPGASLFWDEMGRGSYFPVRPNGDCTLSGYTGVKEHRYQFTCTDCGEAFSTFASPSINEPIYGLRTSADGKEQDRVICKPGAAKRPEEWPDWPE